MSWIRKDRTVSGQTLVKSSISTENLNCVLDEFDMSSASATDVPTQASVRDYVRTYATAPVIEGNQAVPSDAYIAGLLQQNGIHVKAGESVLYLYKVGGKVIDSRSVRLVEREWSVDVQQGTKLDISNNINNYMSQLASQDTSPFARSDWFKTDAFTIPTTKDRLVVTNGDVTDYCVAWASIATEIGSTYTITGNITSTNGNGVKVRRYVQFPLSTSLDETVGETTGTFSISFVANDGNNLIGFVPTGSTTLTIQDFALKLENTILTNTYTANVNYGACVKSYSLQTVGSSNEDLATLVVEHDGSTLNENTETSNSELPLVFKYSRSVVGTSRQRVLLTATISETVEVNGEDVTITQTIEKFINLSVTVTGAD